MPKVYYDTQAKKKVRGRRRKKIYDTQQQRLQQDKEFREKVLHGIQKYYNNYLISENVRDLEVDRKRFKENQFKMSPTAKRAIYERYGLGYYSSYREFYDSKKELYMSEVQIKALWVEYEHRDMLIISGQYEEYRMQAYKENYIKGLERLGATQEEIEQVRNLTDVEFEKLMIPNGDKNNLNKSKLPELGLFAYNDIDSLNRVRKDLNKAFKEELGKEYVYNEDNTALKKRQNKLYRFIDVHDRDDIISDQGDATEYYSTIDLFPASKIKKSKPDKYGRSHYYVPFLGSERNSVIVRDIVARKKKMGLLD